MSFDDTHKQESRYYVSDTQGNSKYVLPADEVERARLDLQAQMINRTLDNKLIWAPISLKNDDIILDSGTGSGHWLLSVANEHTQSNIQFRGIDIEPRMFPPSSPSNVTFTTGSITNLPPDWTNSISLIHQRLLIVALQEHQWKAALKEMYRVLAPGGWVQLVEPHHIFSGPLDSIRNHTIFKIRDKLIFESRRVTMDIVRYLAGWLEEAGFVNIKIECRKLPLGSWAGEDGRSGGRATIGFFSGIKGLAMKEGGFGLVSSEEEYDAAVADLMKLCEETPETYFDYYVHTAQRLVV